MSANRQETTEERMERLEAQAAWVIEVLDRIEARLKTSRALATTLVKTLGGEYDGEASDDGQ